jgi:hypothetical protein
MLRLSIVVTWPWTPQHHDFESHVTISYKPTYDYLEVVVPDTIFCGSASTSPEPGASHWQLLQGGMLLLLRKRSPWDSKSQDGR